VNGTTPIFASVPTFAGLVGLSERMVWSLVADGSIPVTRIGRRTLVRVSAGADALERLGVRQKSPSAR
jgi:hypothetical protein